MRFYEDYKPFRNYIRRFSLEESLVDVWRYSLHILNDAPLPADYAIGKPPFEPIKRNVWPWELEILAREIVLNATTKGDRSLRRWNDLAGAINHIKRLDNEAYKAFGDQRDVLLEMHRIAHRQFPWQIRISVNPLMRAFRIFGRGAVEPIVIREFGLTMRQVLLLGTAMTGHFQKSAGMSNYDCSELSIPQGSARAFFARIKSTIDALRALTVKQQSYDPDWSYAWNPLEATPLVSYDKNHPERVICPIPFYLLRRISTGIFYDLVNTPDFDNAFGESFEIYVGEVIGFACKPPRFAIMPEESYYIGSKKFHGVDWVLSDDTGHLFIEAKTKRLTLGAKIRSVNDDLDRDLVTMATAIVQHYQNILRALDGKTRWKPDGLPIYPLILTLEDWFIFSPSVVDILNNQVGRLLHERDVSEQVLTDMPFTIASAHEFEPTSQVIAQVGVDAVMSKKTSLEQRSWSLLQFMRGHFPDEMERVNWTVFEADWNQLLPPERR
jgi:hypothetical protein